jgi:hypothetical protein
VPVLSARTRALPALAAGLALVLLCALFAAAPASAAGGTSYTWIGDGTDGNSWVDPDNWLPAGVPGNGDSVTIRPYSAAVCYAHVDHTPANLTLANFTLAEIQENNSLCEASVTGGSISVTGTFTWHGGRLDTPTTLLANSTGTVSPSAGVDDTSYLSQNLTVHGHLVLDKNLAGTDSPGQNVLVAAGSALTVAADGEVDANDSDDIDGASCCTNPPRLVNHGLLRVNGGLLDAYAVEVDNDGRLDATGNGQLRTSEAPSTAGDGASYTGDGSWQYYTASITRLTGTQTVGADFHLVLGGNGTGGHEELGGTFTLAGTGTLDWNGGEIEGNATISHGFTVRADGRTATSDDRELSGTDGTGASSVASAVVNHGTVAFSGGAGYYAADGPQLSNASDGLLSFGAGTTLSGDCCSNPNVIANHGGHVTVGAGAKPVDLDETRYLDYAGTTTVPARQTLQLTGGAPSLLSSSTLTGGGLIDVRAYVHLTKGATVGAGTTLRLTGYPGRFDGTATVSGKGDFDWTGGTVTGALRLATAHVRISGTQAKDIAQYGGSKNSTVTVAAPASVAAGTSAHQDEIDLEGNSLLDFTGTTTVGADVTFSHGRLANSGSLTVDARAGHPVTVSAAGYTNSGRTEFAAGMMRVDDNVSQGTHGAAVFALGASTAGTLAVHGTLTLNGKLQLINLGSYTPKPSSVRTVATAGAKPVLHLSCTITTGHGTSGPAARHWTAAASGDAVRLHSAKGRRTSC